MRVIFVRHGHPNYKNDCLTELGHLHAEAAAERLSGETLKAIYASSCGRAVETAEHIAARHGLPVIQCDFMREISWGSADEEPIHLKGHPWDVADWMVSQGQSIMQANWTEEEPFQRNKVTQNALRVGKDFDQWLAELGYEREGDYYRVCNANEDTVMMVSHGGASSAVFSRLFNLPFPFVCHAFDIDFTSIAVLRFSGENGSLTAPKIELLDDARHIAGITLENP